MAYLNNKMLFSHAEKETNYRQTQLNEPYIK